MYVQEAARVQKATEPLQGVSAKTVVESLLQTPIEACSDYIRDDLIGTPGYHSFVHTVERAFSDHRPLILSPDMLWLMMAQGFAQHVNLNAEQLRRRFVEHDGKKEIVVRRDDFVKGSPENPWDEAFTAFSEKIQEYIGTENHGNIVVDFSTTGKVEKAANEVVLMESMKAYFDYTVRTLCGIPEVTLEGEVADWEKLRDKTEDLGKAYDLRWWTDHVHPIFDRIAQNVAGADDPELWENFFKLQGGSGGPFINGWINVLLPYIKTYQTNGEAKATNKYVESWKDGRGWGGLTHDQLPLGLCQTPFNWEYFDQKFQMEFVAGFCGATQEEGLALRPKIGWAIRDKGAKRAERPERSNW